MILAVGLGNPGNKYVHTRHNVGFDFIDLLLKDATFLHISSSKFKGELYKKGSLLLLKPHTFMNLSGNSVKIVNDFYKPDRVIVIHDDLDLNLGAVRFKMGGSSGGHNGIKSIDSSIGVGYERIRLGIGRDRDIISFVLSRFNAQEQEIIDNTLSYTKTAFYELIDNDINSVSAKFSRKTI